MSCALSRHGGDAMSKEAFEYKVLEFTRDDGIATLKRFIAEHPGSDDAARHQDLLNRLLAGAPAGFMTLVDVSNRAIISIVIADDPEVRKMLALEERRKLEDPNPTVH